jgi:hypothetical protein
LSDVLKFLLSSVFYRDGSDEGFTEWINDFFLSGSQEPLGLGGDAVGAEHAYEGDVVACGDVEVSGVLDKNFVPQFALKVKVRCGSGGFHSCGQVQKPSADSLLIQFVKASNGNHSPLDEDALLLCSACCARIPTLTFSGEYWAWIWSTSCWTKSGNFIFNTFNRSISSST